MERTNGVSDILLQKLKKAVDENLTNDQFGVGALARSMGMSRSHLHRKLSSATGQSISQFIREYRLQLGMELLKQGDLTAAEVADRIGFGSPTYFNKCYNEYYGFPPGETRSRMSGISTGHDSIVRTDYRQGPAGFSKEYSWQRIAGTIVAVAVIASTLTYYLNRAFAVRESEDESIAILPFKNLSEDPRTVYFSEGVIEAIRTRLSQIRALRVISRTSVEQYRESSKSASEIARELGVTALLEGSIQRDNDQVRVEVRLVDGRSEGLVWARSFDRHLADVFAIQMEIARQVATELRGQLSPEERSKLSRSETENAQAYDLLLKGVYEYRTYSNRGAHQSIDLLHQAIALDSNYARAYAFLANSYIALATVFGAEWSALEALRKGKPFIDKALMLDPQLDEAHMFLGFYRLYHNWDFEAAEAEYKLAVSRNHPDALALYIDFLNFTSRHEEALVLATRLNERDPYYPNSRMVHAYVYNGRFDEALRFSEARVKMFNNYLTLDSHGFLLLNMQRYPEAIVWFQKAIDLEGIRYPRMLGWMGAAYARSGERDKAMALIDELKTRLEQNEKGSIAFFIAVIYSALGEKASALTWLKNAYEAHDMEMPWLMTEPQFYALREEAEFQQLASLMGLR